MKVSFDYNDLIGTYVMICRDIATMYDIPLKEDELAECFLSIPREIAHLDRLN